MSEDDFADPPRVSCSRCDREWTLDEEYETVGPGGHAVEQFAMDHEQHTGHFPDGVAVWRATCRQCPERATRLTREAARRWAETHVRHTDHPVDVSDGDRGELVGDGDA